MSRENLDCVGGAPVVRAIDETAAMAMYDVYLAVKDEHMGTHRDPECPTCLGKSLMHMR